MGEAREAEPVVGNQLPILLISFDGVSELLADGWESVTNPLDKLLKFEDPARRLVGNQLPILLISFADRLRSYLLRWESVTNPLDKL